MRSMTFLIPDDLHRDFKIKLAEERRSAKEVFLGLISIYVKGTGNGKNKPGKGSRTKQGKES